MDEPLTDQEVQTAEEASVLVTFSGSSLPKGRWPIEADAEKPGYRTAFVKASELQGSERFQQHGQKTYIAFMKPDQSTELL